MRRTSQRCGFVCVCVCGGGGGAQAGAQLAGALPAWPAALHKLGHTMPRCVSTNPTPCLQTPHTHAHTHTYTHTHTCTHAKHTHRPTHTHRALWSCTAWA
jgi:hypothetical protein